MSSGYEWYILLCRKEDYLLLRMRRHRFSFPDRDEAHIILQGDSRLSVGNFSPLLAFHEVGMNPHDLSLRSRNRYEIFLLLVV